MKETLRIRIYRIFVRALQKALLPFFVDEERLENAREIFLVPKHRLDYLGGTRIWFHAASVGELESLWPLIELAAQDRELRVILTVFSSSAHAHALRVMQRLPKEQVLFAGYSPFEGEWIDAIQRLKPSYFVTAKYEAWPELWISLAQENVKLSIVGAKLRSSLKLAKAIVSLLGGVPPAMNLFTFRAENVESLVGAFPSAEVIPSSDPRWDRVFARSTTKQARVQDLIKRFADLPRPWGVFGSVWATDLTEILAHEKLEIAGTPIFVPHKIDAASVAEIEILARDLGFTPIRSTDATQIRPAGKIALVVDEMGFLAELYAQADWAFIGGGFGASLHSTIEPAIYGIPIFAGPSGSEKFDEIAILEGRSQLQLLKTEADWRTFGLRIREELPAMQAKRADWVTAAKAHQGAAQKIWAALMKRRTA